MAKHTLSNTKRASATMITGTPTPRSLKLSTRYTTLSHPVSESINTRSMFSSVSSASSDSSTTSFSSFNLDYLSPAALHLLYFLCFLQPLRISESILLDNFDSFGNLQLRYFPTDPQCYVAARGELCRAKLVRRSRGRGEICMDAGTQVEVRARMGEEAVAMAVNTVAQVRNIAADRSSGGGLWGLEASYGEKEMQPELRDLRNAYHGLRATHHCLDSRRESEAGLWYSGTEGW